MLWKIVGLLLGASVALGMFAEGAGPAARASEILFSVGADTITYLLNLAGASPDHPGRRAFSAVVGVCMPGMLVLVLVLAARLAENSRRVVSAMLAVGAALLLFTYGTTALPAAGLVLAAAALLGLATGLILVVPLTALATVIGVAHARLLHASGTYDGPVSGAAKTLSEIAGTGDPRIWSLGLLVTALGPLWYAVQALLSSPAR